MRRRWLSVAMTFLILAVGLTACDWPQFGLGPAHTGYSASESTLSVANVASVGLSFFSPSGTGPGSSSPVVAGGLAYSVGGSGLLAFDAAGKSGCSGTPARCTPLWSTSAGQTTPAVDNRTLFTTANDNLYAFDAAGQTNCSGTPKVCSPLWTSTAFGGTLTSPTVSNGTVYVGGGDGNVYAFDEAGQTNCSGTLRTCSPLWTDATGGGGGTFFPPAVSDGVLYTGSSDHKLYAFDAAGQTNCSGTPTTCRPLWTASTDGSDSVAVTGGIVYVDGLSAGIDNVNAFDAAGQTNCSGTPKVCNALWTGLGAGQLAVANGVVYAASRNGLVALDAAGNTNCSGVAKICKPLWSAGEAEGPPSVANGVVYTASFNGNIYAYDASGSTDCSGSPTVCGPLATFPADGGTGQVAVANGTLYAGSGGLFAYNLSRAHNYAPVVVVNPASRTATAGQTVTLTATAIGDPAPSVQWYQLVGASWVPIPGANADSYSFTAQPPGGAFYALFTNTFGDTSSASASIFVPG